jgi:hypothetical protein
VGDGLRVWMNESMARVFGIGPTRIETFQRIAEQLTLMVSTR